MFANAILVQDCPGHGFQARHAHVGPIAYGHDIACVCVAAQQQCVQHFSHVVQDIRVLHIVVPRYGIGTRGAVGIHGHDGGTPHNDVRVDWGEHIPHDTQQVCGHHCIRRRHHAVQQTHHDRLRYNHAIVSGQQCRRRAVLHHGLQDTAARRSHISGHVTHGDVLVVLWAIIHNHIEHCAVTKVVHKQVCWFLKQRPQTQGRPVYACIHTCMYDICVGNQLPHGFVGPLHKRSARVGLFGAVTLGHDTRTQCVGSVTVDIGVPHEDVHDRLEPVRLTIEVLVRHVRMQLGTHVFHRSIVQ
ncbi:hypothetical protein ORF039R [Spotted knifejaw iridovirus]|nr:hypothetical protein ORF039R [Spotted knifejaw iridovirus]